MSWHLTSKEQYLLVRYTIDEYLLMLLLHMKTNKITMPEIKGQEYPEFYHRKNTAVKQQNSELWTLNSNGKIGLLAPYTHHQ